VVVRLQIDAQFVMELKLLHIRGIETITYKDLNFWKKRKAVKLFNKIYKKLRIV
jgi:hypothetical protein